MGIFSNGQFDIIDQWYVFNSKKKSFVKADGSPQWKIALHYTIVPKLPNDYHKVVVDKGEGSMEFALTLFDGVGGLGSNAGSVSGKIDIKGPNKDYYSKVNEMRKKAFELFERQRESRMDVMSYR